MNFSRKQVILSVLVNQVQNYKDTFRRESGRFLQNPVGAFRTKKVLSEPQEVASKRESGRFLQNPVGAFRKKVLSEPKKYLQT